MSLRARLLLGMGAIALVLVLAGAAIARTTERHLVSQVDDQLRDAGPALNALPRSDQQPGYGGPPDGGTQAPRLSRLYVGRITADGALVTLYAPDLSGEEGSAPALSAGDIAALRSGDAITARTENGDAEYRVLARNDRRRGGGLTVAALPLDDVQESVRRLVAVELLAGAAVLGVLGLVSWWVIHLGVRPVRRMTEAASAIAAGDLSRRVPEGASGTESAELGAALNQMLGRIEDAFEERIETEARLRRFLADASHELRTPVATIRGYAELYRTGALSGGDMLADAMRRTEQEAVRMGDLIDELLQLARLDQGRAPEPVPVDLATLAADAALDAQATAPDRTVTTEIEPATVVQGDEGRLRQVVSNLVGNALVHAPDAPIHLTVRTDGPSAVLEVADDGPGMDPTDAGRAFERFYRADASRQRHRGGSGLGLAIVEATVRAHGGTVGLDTAPGKGTTVRVTLPLAAP
jgi:two-component system OmpR family sensor kinase